jgi:hypothetical protein
VKNGEYYYFFCDTHKHEKSIEVSKQVYRCQHPGCDKPGHCYWYQGEQFAKLEQHVCG